MLQQLEVIIILGHTNLEFLTSRNLATDLNFDFHRPANLCGFDAHVCLWQADQKGYQNVKEKFYLEIGNMFTIIFSHSSTRSSSS